MRDPKSLSQVILGIMGLCHLNQSNYQYNIRRGFSLVDPRAARRQAR